MTLWWRRKKPSSEYDDAKVERLYDETQSVIRKLQAAIEEMEQLNQDDRPEARRDG